jgi:hypothetical protein
MCTNVKKLHSNKQLGLLQWLEFLVRGNLVPIGLHFITCICQWETHWTDWGTNVKGDWVFIQFALKRVTYQRFNSFQSAKCSHNELKLMSGAFVKNLSFHKQIAILIHCGELKTILSYQYSYLKSLVNRNCFSLISKFLNQSLQTCESQCIKVSLFILYNEYGLWWLSCNQDTHF